MPGTADRILKHRLHKASARAVVTLSGRDYYLARFGTDASREKYNRLIAQWLASNRQMPPNHTSDLIVVEVMAAYWQHARAHCLRADGRSTSKLANQRQAFRPLRRLYGSTVAAEFGSGT